MMEMATDCSAVTELSPVYMHTLQCTLPTSRQDTLRISSDITESHRNTPPSTDFLSLSMCLYSPMATKMQIPSMCTACALLHVPNTKHTYEGDGMAEKHAWGQKHRTDTLNACRPKYGMCICQTWWSYGSLCEEHESSHVKTNETDTEHPQGVQHKR